MWVNYLLSLETQGETFHVINISWFSMKVVHFLQEVFMTTLNVPFSICQIKISNNPSHPLSMYDIFNGENSKLSTLAISMLAQAAFLWCIEVSVPNILWHKFWRHLFEIILGAKKNYSRNIVKQNKV